MFDLLVAVTAPTATAPASGTASTGCPGLEAVNPLAHPTQSEMLIGESL